MKRNILKIIGGSIFTFTVILTVALGVAFAQEKAELQGSGGRIDGTWNVRVTLRNCQTGAAITSFDSLTTFMSGGILLDSTSNIPQAMKTPGQGVWSHTTNNTYQFSFKSFSFDAAGVYTGWTIIRHEAVLNSRGTAYESMGTAEIYAPDGTLTVTRCSTTTATRFE